jgi:hypothetical protein
VERTPSFRPGFAKSPAPWPSHMLFNLEAIRQAHARRTPGRQDWPQGVRGPGESVPGRLGISLPQIDRSLACKDVIQKPSSKSSPKSDREVETRVSGPSPGCFIMKLIGGLGLVTVLAIAKGAGKVAPDVIGGCAKAAGRSADDVARAAGRSADDVGGAVGHGATDNTPGMGWTGPAARAGARAARNSARDEERREEPTPP